MQRWCSSVPLGVLVGVALLLSLATSTTAHSSDGTSSLSSRDLRKLERRGVTASALNSVCPATRPLQSGEIWKHIASTHIPRSDPRRYSTSFITLRGKTAPSFSCLKLYDAAGNLVHKLGRYYPSGSKYSSRSYGGSGCGDRKSARQVAQRVRANSGSLTVYLKVRSNQCVELPRIDRCYNSSVC